jgi:hypothetical protein
MKRPLIAALILATSAVAIGAVAAPAQASSCGKTEYADGTFGPTVCPDGGANKAVASVYEKGTPAIMSLKAGSTRKQILKAICSDSKTAFSAVVLYDSLEYQIANYDWRRSFIHPVMKKVVAEKYC